MFVIMDNVIEIFILNCVMENEINWGVDVVFWGGNENY